MLSSVFSAGLSGIDGYIVTVESDTKKKLPGFELVGLPDAAVKEAKERVRSACENSGFPFPAMSITVNLAPADKKKEGSGFDAAILAALLSSAGAIPDADFSGKCIVGELSLSGELRSVRGILCMCAAAKDAGLREFYCPESSAPEASAVKGIDVFPVRNMRQLIDHLNGVQRIKPLVPEKNDFSAEKVYDVDLSDVKGQIVAKRALEVAAAGGHNILFIGPPGTGKSMLAKRLPTILPPLEFEEAIVTTKIHSVSGILPDGASLVSARPFRSPHHTMSAVSLVGGGISPKPGEVSLAHNGVLFLDELPEFPKTVTDSLRQPLEDGKVTITRAAGRITFPCSFMLVAAMNPCRCGYFGHPTKKCTCRADEVRRYFSRISGPLLDRMDIQVEVPSLSYDELSSTKIPSENSATVRKRVIAARAFAKERLKKAGETKKIFCNAQMGPAEIRKYCPMDDGAKDFLQKAYDVLGLSARGYDRVMRLARTIADLDGSEIIKTNHIAEAVHFRTLDRKYLPD